MDVLNMANDLPKSPNLKEPISDVALPDQTDTDLETGKYFYEHILPSDVQNFKKNENFLDHELPQRENEIPIEINGEIVGKISERFRELKNEIGESGEKLKTYDARVVRIDDLTVTLDCLVDRENKVFETREFEKDLFKNSKNLSLGDYFVIRKFKKPGKISFVIHRGDKLVDKSNFEDFPEFSDLDDIENSQIDLERL